MICKILLSEDYISPPNIPNAGMILVKQNSIYVKEIDILSP